MDFRYFKKAVRVDWINKGFINGKALNLLTVDILRLPPLIRSAPVVTSFNIYIYIYISYIKNYI